MISIAEFETMSVAYKKYLYAIQQQRLEEHTHAEGLDPRVTALRATIAQEKVDEAVECLRQAGVEP